MVQCILFLYPIVSNDFYLDSAQVSYFLLIFLFLLMDSQVSGRGFRNKSFHFLLTVSIKSSSSKRGFPSV